VLLVRRAHCQRKKTSMLRQTFLRLFVPISRLFRYLFSYPVDVVIIEKLFCFFPILCLKKILINYVKLLDECQEHDVICLSLCYS